MRDPRGLLDTSIFIASEPGRPLAVDLLPDRGAVSVVTVAELQAGVLAAREVATRARRLATLAVLDDIEVLPIDLEVARIWAALRVALAEVGRRVNVNDLWIAATALRHDLPVVTQDGDFDPLAGMTAGGSAALRVRRV